MKQYHDEPEEVLQNASPYKQTEKDMVSGGAQPEICLCEAKMAFLKGLLQNAKQFATVPFHLFCTTEVGSKAKLCYNSAISNGR